METIKKFERGMNAGTKVCKLCKKRTWKSKGVNGADGDYCEKCTEKMELENEHNDGCHDDHVDGCPLCEDPDELDDSAARIAHDEKTEDLKR